MSSRLRLAEIYELIRRARAVLDPNYKVTFKGNVVTVADVIAEAERGDPEAIRLLKTLLTW